MTSFSFSSGPCAPTHFSSTITADNHLNVSWEQTAEKAKHCGISVSAHVRFLGKKAGKTELKSRVRNGSFVVDSFKLEYCKSYALKFYLKNRGGTSSWAPETQIKAPFPRELLFCIN